jgi:hypothetical protein
MRIETHRGSRRIALLIRNFLARPGWVCNATPGPLYNGAESWYPFYRTQNGPTAGLKKGKSLAPQWVLNPELCSPVASRYTDYAVSGPLA